MILVTGATGNVGRWVVDQLARAGQPVRALTRDPTGKTFPDGVRVAVGDLGRPETLAAAFDGVDRMVLLPLAETARQVVALARDAGVRRLVVLSSSAVEDDGDDRNYANGVYRPVERAVEQSGLEWTHVRGGEFMANTLEVWAPSIRTEGVVRDIHGEVRGAPVHEADVAEVAVAALLQDGHAGRKYVVTGPEAITRRQQVRIIAEVVDRKIRFEELTPEQARARWRGWGVPEDAIEYIVQPPGTLDPSVNPVSPDYRRVLGRPGRDYRQWVTDHVDAFR